MPGRRSFDTEAAVGARDGAADGTGQCLPIVALAVVRFAAAVIEQISVHHLELGAADRVSVFIYDPAFQGGGLGERQVERDGAVRGAGVPGYLRGAAP